MIAELVEAPVFGRVFKRRWATGTTTTTDNALPDISIASAAVSRPEANLIYVALPYSRKLDSLPPNIGRAVPVEGVLEQVGNVEDAIATSHLFPLRVLSIGSLGLLFNSSYHRSLLPSQVHASEILNWDAAIEVAPKRPSGKLTVTLRYAGRGTPSPVENPWDD